MRKKKDIPVIEGFEITGVAAEGKSLGRWNDLVVFVPFGAPGDVIDLKIDRKKHSYADGHIASIAKLNKLRFQRDDMNRDIDTAVSLGLPRDYINQSLNE